MDYLAFGLLAGSLIVIASFVVRDGLPHLAAIAEQSRLARISRAATPVAWARWCADTGLVLAAAGTLVLVITVAALLADLSDSAGNLLVGLSAAVAVIASVLGAARLGQRLRVEAEAETDGELALPAQPVPSPQPQPRRAQRNRPAGDVEPVSAPPVQPAAGLTVETSTVWDDELPTWSPPSGRTDVPDAGAHSGPATNLDTETMRSTVSPELHSSTASPEAPPPRRPRVLPSRPSVEPSMEPPDVPEKRPIRDEELEPPVSGGLFRSPLLADIGLTPGAPEAEEQFQSPLLSGLLGEAQEHDAAEVGTGSDLLIDETPAPVQPSGRLRDELDNH